MPSRKKSYSSVIGLVVLLAVIAAIIYLKSEQVVPVIVEEVPVAVTDQPRLAPQARPIMKVEEALAIQNNRNQGNTGQTNEINTNLRESVLENDTQENGVDADSQQAAPSVWEAQEDIITADTVDEEAETQPAEAETFNSEQ